MLILAIKTIPSAGTVSYLLRKPFLEPTRFKKNSTLGRAWEHFTTLRLEELSFRKCPKRMEFRRHQEKTP